MFSWTVITWVVIIGSSVVMLAWIAIYSLFESIDFVDEVVILFGELTFWTAVLVSVVIALGEYAEAMHMLVLIPLQALASWSSSSKLHISPSIRISCVRCGYSVT